ncbi:G-protein coupled receptor Mth2 isoform X5 [Leptinotarsa decemlineata]|uniref:G-protein coupled receptor Mth2 isoform X5 n=1 Tax=Leptinotarsa decemlineata TaxID=7539 RepID=UPI003D30472D
MRLEGCVLLVFWCFTPIHCICPKILSVNLTNSKKIGSKITEYGVTFNKENYFVENGSTFGCICDIKKCIRKCCETGESDCVSTDKVENYKFYNETRPIAVNANDFFFLHHDHCEVNNYKISLEKQFYLQENGFLYGFDFIADYMMFSPKEYCLDFVNKSLTAFVCFPESEEPTSVYSTGMIISMPFLLATFLVYALLPEPNLHRRALMSYVATLLMGYILLVSVQLSSEGISDVSCNLLGYLIIFFFTVSFFWMNVMCIDMWLAFRGMRSFGDRKGAERKRFIIYCCYAWGMPLVDILIIFLLNTYGDQTSSYYPAIGIQRCFVGEGLPNFLYFYLLAMLILIINIVLFILTGFKIHKVQRETSVLKHSDSKRHAYEDDKQQYKLYVKLLFAMGVNWITEIISWAIGYFWQETPKAVFYFTDFINATYGVFIFFIFVFKRKIWTSLKKRYYICIGKPHLAHAMSTTRGGTRTSNFSTTETGTSVHTDYRMNEMRNGKPEERALNRH